MTDTFTEFVTLDPNRVQARMDSGCDDGGMVGCCHLVCGGGDDDDDDDGTVHYLRTVEEKGKRRRMGRKDGMKRSEQKNERIDDLKRAKCNPKE